MNRTMTLSKSDLEKFAKRQGGKVVCESSGKYAVYQCEAPKGMVWNASRTHVLRVDWRQGQSEERNDAVSDAIERMSHGVGECCDDECDYCKPFNEPESVVDAKAESREHERSATTSLFGRSYCFITCPYCQTEAKAFIWSLSGGGKRCPSCKAMHTAMGFTFAPTSKLSGPHP